MAIPKFEVDMDIMSKVPMYPADGGFTPEGFRAEFDKAGKLLQEYINTILIPKMDETIDVDALIRGILDESLTASDKAAPAKVVGDLVKRLALQRITAKTFEKAVRSGDFLVDYDQNLKVEMVSNTKVRVYGGAYVTQGNYVELNPGSYAELNTQSGTAGLFRNDLVCGRYQRDEEGNVTHSIVVVTGSPAQAGGVDPDVSTGYINSDSAVIHDTPIARLKYSGTAVTAEMIIAKKRSEITLLASGWSASAPYTQTITVAGLNDELFAKAYPVWPSDLAEKLALSEETAKVRSCERSGSSMTFQCWEEKPTLDIPIVVEVYV